ncbi:hypothetical protein [Allobranchiibius huperziae]|uniref:Uncharacterized protein n=1 Tax=Allobranchiibius huperziae TaxID=1874116 RepID=A0A853DLB6_9MICO|nr:hypothetical protein [Allobranchiibius huperziae]NYJ74935.1 hypothetical protein [Allobranchiibius huperziae]
MANDRGGAHTFDSNAQGSADSTNPRTTRGQWPADDQDTHQGRGSDERDHRDHRRPRNIDHESITTAQKEEHGGIKIGSAFFGWLTATGMAVLLTALLAAIGAGVGLANKTDVTKATNAASNNSTTVGIVGAIALLVIVLVAYYCGGYVAGRMARFNGIRQGIAVWVWALVIAIVLAIVAAVAGDKYNVLSKLNAFPRIPVKEGTLTTTGVIALIAVAVASLVGAILGGLAGMHYHRKIDKTSVQAYRN